MKLLKKLCCPLLFSLFFVAALFFPVAFASADDTVDLKLSEGTYRYDYAYEVFKLVNEERARVHLEPLVMDACHLQPYQTGWQRLLYHLPCKNAR